MSIVLTIDTNLDIIGKQRELVSEALGSEGVYIRMKETLEELLTKGEIKKVDSAKIIAETVAQMATNITDASMSTAIQWAAKEKELELQKKELESKLDIMKHEKNKAEQDVLISKATKQITQAQMLREYGVPTTDGDGNVTALSNAGKIYEETLLIKQQTANELEKKSQLTAQTKEVQARTHQVIADTYVNHGVFSSYTVSDSGVSNVTKDTTSYVTLSEMNKKVAAEQAKGYAWNAWSNAASSSAGMIGTLVASEIPGLVDDAQDALSTWSSVVSNLKDIAEPTITT